MKKILTEYVECYKTIILIFSFFLLGHLFLHGQSPEIDTIDDHLTQTQKNSEHTVLKDEEGLTLVAERPEGWTTETHHKSAGCNYGLLFDDSKVQRIDIIINPQVYKDMEEDVAKIKMKNKDICPVPEPSCVKQPYVSMNHDANRENTRKESNIKPMYGPVTLLYNGLTWHHVGMRYKGNSTLITAREKGHKLPFRLDFDKFEDDYPEISDQRFYGFRAMTFSNNFFDASFLREKVCADIFRNGGVPAARGAFYRVFVDTGDGPLYWGLYTMIEEPSDRMLHEQFGNNIMNQSKSKGNLYKPEGAGATWSEFDPKSFIKKTNKKDGDFSDIRGATSALHASRSNPALWRDNLEAVFDIRIFIRWLAINTAIVNWDSYGSMTHNYYLYRNMADNGRLVWFPWDLNMSMDTESSPAGCLTLALNDVEDNWPLIRYLMDDPVYNALYHRELIAALEGCMNETKLIPYIEKLYRMIRPYIIGKEGEKSGYTYLTHGAGEVDQALQKLIQHIRERNRAVRNYLNSR